MAVAARFLGRRIALLSCASLAGVLACSDAVPPQRLAGQRVTLRLAEDAVAERYREPEQAQIERVTRYVLGGPVEGFLYLREGEFPHTLQATDDGVIELPVHCPEAFLDRDVAAYLSSGGQLHDGVVHCPARAGVPVDLRVRGFEPQERVSGLKFGLIARALTAGRVETKFHRIGPAATLKLAIGNADFGPPERFMPTWFHITGRAPNGRTALLFERRLDPAARPEDRGWVDLEMSLDAVRSSLGADVSFGFETRNEEGTTRSSPVWGDPTILEPVPEGQRKRPWNVVLVSIDTLRADRLGCYGASRATSPVLDQLAADGTVFEVAVAQAPWTLPSHATMLTGLYGCVHGAVAGIGDELARGVVPLAAILRSAGYTTAAFTEDGFLLRHVFARGFGLYRENGNSLVGRVDETVASAVEWLRRDATSPFFLFVHTYQTHDPYDSPPPYKSMFATYPGPAGTPLLEGVPQRERTLAQYDGAIRYTDATLARLFKLLDDLDIAEHILLVVTSDHGEAFDEHGYYGHGKTLHDEVLRVPLLFHAPGLVSGGRRVQGMVGLIDLVPTILELLDIERPHHLQGISLAPLLRPGTSLLTAPSRLLFSENLLGHYRIAARSQRWKALFEGEDAEIFDLASDPAEHAPARSGKFGMLAASARRHFERQCRRVRDELTRSAPTPPPTPPPLPDPDLERRLKALGYLQ